MPEYRVYFIDRANHITRPPEVIQCDNDEQACEKAKQYIDGLDIEVWEGPRLVKKFQRTSARSDPR